MATIQTRPFSGEYSDLEQTGLVAVCIACITLTSFELLRRKRRGRGKAAKWEDGLGSVETWEFGYLYQGRCWSSNPTPRHPKWPLAWIWQVLTLKEEKLPSLIGLDAAIYLRFLRACWWFMLLHTCTTLPVLLPIHVIYSPSTISKTSMHRASLSSLVDNVYGRRLIGVHFVLLVWVASTWIYALIWICNGAFRYQAELTALDAEKLMDEDRQKQEGRLDHRDITHRGLRLRTIMITNIPPQLRDEKQLTDYFQYHLTRPFLGPPITPGFLPRLMAAVFRRAGQSDLIAKVLAEDEAERHGSIQRDAPLVERVVLTRKMTELTSQLERREEVLRSLEQAHIKLAKQTLAAVKERIEKGPAQPSLLARVTSRMSLSGQTDVERQAAERAAEERMQTLVRVLGPFVEEFELVKNPGGYKRLSLDKPEDGSAPQTQPSPYKTVWEALHSLPRDHLDPYQPLIRLSTFFVGSTVPTIDYLVSKLGLLTALIADNRARPVSSHTPSSTAFVTFHNPRDAARACKYLPAHPMNPMACMVDMAPDFRDIDWWRVMKTRFTGEFIKDWVVHIGVWGFTLFWVIPVTLLVGLVSIDNISAYVPPLHDYLQSHDDAKSVLSSLIPTLIVSGLGILIPLILLLIGKQAHTIITLSRLHDIIMMRYYKFLICNVLIFFCVGVSALESFLSSFKNSLNNPVPIIAESFPTAGPFYVGWLMFQTAMHGGLEVALFGLPLLVYPGTRKSPTLRRREVGTRPRTFNFYYWLPNHVLILNIALLFAVFNPLIIPFAWLYYSVAHTVIRNQLIHVYSKFYDLQGRLILIRAVRYSCDGLLFAQIVFIAFVALLRTQYPDQEVQFTVLLGLTGCLMILTTFVKVYLTRWCRMKFEEADITATKAYFKDHHPGNEGSAQDSSAPGSSIIANPTLKEPDEGHIPHTLMASEDAVFVRSPETMRAFNPPTVEFWTWRLPAGVRFSYSTVPGRVNHHGTERPRNPFQPRVTDRNHVGGHNPTQLSDVVESLVGGTGRSNFLFEAHSPLDDTWSPGKAGRAIPLVHPHAPRKPWDDTPKLDTPYDNPAYTLPIDNFLWLPRNPCGLLYIDDSFDLHKAITSEPHAGQLGEWYDNTVPAPETKQDKPPVDGLPSSSDAAPLSQILKRDIKGTESIILPSGIATRVEDVSHERNIDYAGEPADRPYFFTFRGPRPSTLRSSNLSTHAVLGEPTAVQSAFGMRLGEPSSRFRSRPSRQRPPRDSRLVNDPAFEPDLQSQSIFATPSIGISVLRSPRANVTEGAVEQVTTREAVIGEAIAEERIATIRRIQQEEDEADRAMQPRSYWTGWAWKRIGSIPDTPEIPPPEPTTPAAAK